MKGKCPRCGIQGFVERRGNSTRIKHYIGYKQGKRLYQHHYVSIDSLGITGNQLMGINNFKLSSNLEMGQMKGLYAGSSKTMTV